MKSAEYYDKEMKRLTEKKKLLKKKEEYDKLKDEVEPNAIKKFIEKLTAD